MSVHCPYPEMTLCDASMQNNEALYCGRCYEMDYSIYNDCVITSHAVSYRWFLPPCLFVTQRTETGKLNLSFYVLIFPFLLCSNDPVP